HYRLGTISKAVHFAKSLGTTVKFFECNINAAQHGLKRYASILPCLDQCPIECGKQQRGAATTLEVLFYFGEVVEVILHGYDRRLRTLSDATAEALRWASAMRAAGLGALRSQMI